MTLPPLPSLADLNPFDWVLLLALAWSVLTALLRGLLRSLFSLLGLVAGILLASWNYLAVAVFLSRWITSAPTAQATAFLLILSTVAVLAGLLGGLSHKAAHAVGLGLVNRLLGALFGLVRGVLLATACVMALLAFLPRSGLVRNSRLAPYFFAAAHAVSFVVPQTLQQQISDGATQIPHSVPDWIKPSR